MDEPRSIWSIRLFGAFRLENPNGECVRLANRKAEALLAMLVVAGEHGVQRSDVAHILWPDKSRESQLENLRQTLALLRKSIGPHAIFADRESCRFSPDFEYNSDLNEGSPAQGSFMPGFTGEWFDDIRLIVEAPSREERPTPAESFANLVDQLCEIDPDTMYAVMRSSPDLTSALGERQIGELVMRAPRLEKWAGWTEFWLGAVDNDLQKSAAHLKRALAEARQTESTDLAIRSAFELGKAFVRIGDLEQAKSMCRSAKAIAEVSKEKNSISFYYRLKGMLLVNWGDAERGLELFASAENYLESDLLWARSHASRMFFQASISKDTQAVAGLEKCRKIAEASGHQVVKIIADTALGLIELREISRPAGISRLQRTASEARAIDQSQFGAYAEELIAKAMLLEGEKELATTHFRNAQRERRRSQMVLTPLEAKRLELVS